MEDILDVYQRPHDPECPMVCVDETSKQLIAETRVPIAAKPGRAARYDYEYRRNGALLQRCWRIGILREFGAKGFRFSCWAADHAFQASFERQTPHSPAQRHRVTNWREYDASLRNRGSLTIWFTPEAIAGWKAQPRTTPGGQRHYSDLAIETALTLRTAFRSALRQSEGLIGSIMKMLEIDLPVPDHTTLSRRACGLPVCNLARIGTERTSPDRRQHGTEIAGGRRMVG